MLFLLLQAGGERFAIGIEPIVEVIPYVNLKTFPQAPPEIAGLMNYRGRITPIVDLSVLLCGKTARPLMSTRIIMISTRSRGETSASLTADDSPPRLLGLLAEKVLETVRCEAGDLHPPNLHLQAAPYLGEIIPKDGDLIQRLYVDRLISPNLLETLYSSPGAPE
jgi:chemotaxis-related protein WspB